MLALLAQTLATMAVVAVMLARIFGGVALFARGLELRPHVGLRVLVVALACVATYALFLGIASLVLDQMSASTGYLVQFLVFSLILVVCVGLVLLFCRTSVWVALFCVTAGYSMQNLCSGTSELLNVLGALAGLDTASYLSPAYWANSLLPIVVVFPLAWWLVVRKVDAEGLRRIEDHGMLAMMPVVSLVIIGFDLTIKSMTADGLATSYVVVLRLMHGAACVFVIWLEYELLYQRRLAQDKATTERLLAERAQQYERSRENIEAINLKCHDLKHQIRTLASGGATVDPAALGELEREVQIYDASYHTGSDVLDTILTEKGLVCGRQGISLTCMADGAALGFVAPADLYALFGNALDNAIAAAGALEPGRRTVAVVVRRAMGAVSVHVENPYASEVRFGADGLPQTTKPDAANHGFGSRSMRGIAQRYGGSYAASADGGTFRLDILIPEP